MNTIKKIAKVVLIAFLTVFGTYSMSEAYYVGQFLTVTYDQYANSSNIFCVEHGQALTANNDYKVISNVKIEGTKSTDHTGKIRDNESNAKFAYILSASNGSNKDSGPVANEIWNYGYTWMQNVGQYHEGLSLGFMSAVRGNSNQSITQLDQESTQYANNISSGTSVIDHTEKDKIKVEAYNKDGKEYLRVGPFNWTFGGKLTEVSVYDQNNSSISEVIYSSYTGNIQKWINVGDIKSGTEFYISIPADKGVSKITKISGKMQVDTKAVNIWFLQSTTQYKQNLIIREPYNATQDIELSFDYNISVQGNLKVIKVNKDNKIIKLSGVGFYIQNKNTGKYVKRASDGQISYVDTTKQATEFVTDKNGEILIKNLIVGTYVAYETKNPNYGYEIISEGKEKAITVDKTAELEIQNKQIYVKLSGYVWLDKISSKQSYRNDLYKDNDYDSDDILLDNIIVRLKDRSGNTVKEAKTSRGGAYLFTDVLIEKLEDYYIEFEYDGLTYTNVVPHIDKDNGSKAAEKTIVRQNFNNDFSVVEGRSSNTGITLDSNNNEKHTLTYNIDQNEHTATLINNGLYPITANTDEAKYSIEDHFTYGQEEIKNINLGLYEREQPDIALVKDLQNVKVTVNGYHHVYNYAQRFENQGEYGDGFNVGVKFGNKYGNMSYSRAVYQADYEYINENDRSKELKVYVTYQLAMKNQSSNLMVQVNNIADYYDSKYTITKVGTGIDDQGNVVGDISHTDTTYNDTYTKTIIHTNTRMGAQKQESVYVQFELNREAVLNILNNKENLNNVAEINSYSVFDDKGVVYAGIDQDSNPGNTIPGDTRTYEDDTDSAPGLQLEVADARELTGKVFLDSTSEELMTGEIRQGSGAYEEGEKGIKDVTVTLTENTGSGKVYTATTDENGEFLIEGYIPGDYTLTYIWGDITYTVQSYKGTIYNNKERANDKQWYKTESPRYSDAIDDYELRQQIDNEMLTVTNKTVTTIDKMNSTTPTMGIGVEYETTYTASEGDRYTYRISNIDFGIVERARQQLDLGKRVSTFKVTLANGQVIADVKINEDGTMTGETNHVTYMRPSEAAIPRNGFIKLELDNELIQGATVEVGYEIKATNMSELDYLSENFYKYGTIEGQVVTMTPTAIIDYLDKDWAFDANKNTAWQVKTLEDIKDIVAETVYNNENSTISDKIILYTETLKEQKLEPKNSATVMLNVSKVLSNSDEISLDNETEILEITRTAGSMPDPTPGNYVPGTGKTESDDSTAETVIVTPNTGANLNFIIPVMVGVVALVILATGVVVIKKKTL